MYDNGKVELYEDSPTPLSWPADAAFAMGSGDQAALAALLCGKDPIEAVDIACRINNQCGLPVVYAKVAALVKEP